MKLSGNNVFEATFGPDILLYDFDSGLAANDVIGILTGGANADLGLGQFESLAVGGDSGSPAFLNGLIAGVHSFRNAINGSVGDAIPGLNGSFGEIAFDICVSTKASFIDAIIDETGAPSITDVTLSGSSWVSSLEYAFSDLVAAGDQLRPIATQNVNTIEIAFSEHVLLDGSELELRYTERLSTGAAQNSTVASTNFSCDVGSHVGTWTFGNLGDGKYSLELSTDVTDVAGNALDGEWTASTNGTIDLYSDDPNGTFAVGNGIAGSPDYDEDGDQEFRLHFALLAGDYNGDGIVEATEAVTGDGDGDGTVGDADDINLRNAQVLVDATLPLRGAGGDFDDNEVVDVNDLVRWKEGFGSEFNGAGFFAWQRAWMNTSVWFAGTANFGTTTSAGPPPLTVGDFAPQVMNLIVSGSASTHAPYGFDAVDGSGLQLATVPVGGADTISVVFSEAVNVTSGNLRVIGLRTSTTPVVADFSYDTNTHTATWRFESWDTADHYMISVSDAVTDVDGNMLDGEWTNPSSLFTTNSAISTFPSGDGTVGGVFNFVATILPGDLNLDSIVGNADLNLFIDNLTNASGITNPLFTDGDVNGDGAIDFLDIGPFLNGWGSNLQYIVVFGDLNGDNVVDKADIDIIDDNFGMTSAGYMDGDMDDDMDGDGDVDLDDLDIAYAQYGLAIDMVS